VKTPGAIGRWRAFWRSMKGEPQPFIHRHDPEAVRARQRAAAREAFLSTLPPGQRVLAARQFGDVQ
jgi:hypothetical protein